MYSKEGKLKKLVKIQDTQLQHCVEVRGLRRLEHEVHRCQ